MNEIPKQNFDFLIKKIELLAKERAELLDIQEKRLTIFSVIVGVSISSLGFLLDEKKAGDFYVLIPTICSLLGFTVFLIGCLTFIRIIQRSLEISFLSKEQTKLLNYISAELEESDEIKLDITKYSNRFKAGGSGFLNNFFSSVFGLAMIVGLFNSLILSVFICFVLRFTLLEKKEDRGWLPYIGVFIYLVVLSLHLWYNRRQIRKIKDK